MLKLFSAASTFALSPASSLHGRARRAVAIIDAENEVAGAPASGCARESCKCLAACKRWKAACTPDMGNRHFLYDLHHHHIPVRSPYPCLQLS